jgi:glycosyltransferase involved in cell wall biosynthesis
METYISVIIPVYNEEGNIRLLYNELYPVLTAINQEYEILFIDDGSSDTTFRELSALVSLNHRVKILKFRKNFGKSAALNAAFHYATGGIVITMDGDLQDDSQEIPRFIAKINEGFDLVSGWRSPRNDPWGKRVPSQIFNTLTRLITRVDLHDVNCGFKAYKKEVVKNLRLYGEMHRYIPALVAWNGYTITEIIIRHRRRQSGKSKYRISRIIKGLMDLIAVKFLTNYASRPLHVFGAAGIASLFAGTAIGIYLLFLKFLRDEAIGERPLLLLASLLIFVGFQFVSLGLLGEMMAYRQMSEENPDRYIESVLCKD